MRPLTYASGIGTADTLTHVLRQLATLSPTLVVLYLRVSWRDQIKHLKDQEERLRRACEERGHKVIKVFKHVFSSRAAHRDELERAGLYALEHGATLAADSRDRFVRNKRDFNAQPTSGEIDTVQRVAWNVPMATRMHPDECWKVVRGQQIKSGMKKKSGRKRGWKKRKHQILLPKVLRLRKEGLSIREITKALGLKRSTVAKWIAG